MAKRSLKSLTHIYIYISYMMYNILYIFSYLCEFPNRKPPATSTLMLEGTEDALMAKVHETVAALELAAAAVLESKRPKVEIKEEVEGAWAEGVKRVFKWKGFFVVVVVVAA